MIILKLKSLTIGEELKATPLPSPPLCGRDLKASVSNFFIVDMHHMRRPPFLVHSKIHTNNFFSYLSYTIYSEPVLMIGATLKFTIQNNGFNNN